MKPKDEDAIKSERIIARAMREAGPDPQEEQYLVEQRLRMIEAKRLKELRKRYDDE
jgi:hypothetical protein